MRAVKVECDNCQADLAHTGNAIDYRVVVCSEMIPHRPGEGACTFPRVNDPLPNALYFCSLACLRGWANTDPKE